MKDNVLERLFEHNNWANLRLIEACAALTDAQLDAPPQPPSTRSIRQILTHLASAQQSYLSLLTLPVEARRSEPPAFADLAGAVTASGEGLLAIARGGSGARPAAQLRTKDGYLVEPWVVMAQVINHATVHREQICGMLRAMGVTPPSFDGWDYGEAVNALAPAPP